MRKLFLLEDDLSLISGLTFAFKKQGFALDTARTLAEAEVLWSDRKYDLLVLDVSLPDGSGFDFCQKVRRTSNVPILFLTASDEEMNIIMGLELGGDDYLTKPFALEELEARVRTLLRREFRQRESLDQAVQAGCPVVAGQCTASPCKCVQRRRTRTGIGQHHRPAVAGAGIQKRNLAGTDRRRVQAALLLYAASECRAIQGTNSGCTVGLRWGLH